MQHSVATGRRAYLREDVLPLDFDSSYFDPWVFRRSGGRAEYLLLHVSQEKADRFFGGGRFWQIPTGAVGDAESVADACR